MADLLRSLAKCHECGERVRLHWMLYCDKCYARLVSGDSHAVDKSRGKVFCDKVGRKYVFGGKGWFRVP